ncbi:hypothetical protein [Microbacterium sp. H1-D42]|uniref:hypothetical protein n=1 Tax=Microbacterium sp. H1-D42 TaxID=2925844 RepID=UPI001F539E6B|nr:hypothetical protein [Microbacterium sp. H1-D42]UNK70795.1 hypothetical protein MNR00_16825 [Microbacterium sp. H1-D42]
MSELGDGEAGGGGAAAQHPTNAPARVRVTAPRAGVAGAPTRPLTQLSPVGPTSDIAGVYVRSLIRSQLRLAVVFAAGFVAATVLFVLVIVLVPGLDSSYVFGVPASWLLLGGGIYPLTITVAALYVRVASRNEARYRSLAEDA